MSGKGSISFIELHVEKLVLGLAGALLLGLIVYYFGIGPNKVEFRGTALGPAVLDETILQQAQELKRTFAGKRAEETPVPNYAQELSRRLNEGVLGVENALVPRALRVTAAFGLPLPVFEEEQPGPTDVTLVTPLPPSQPVVRTGISLVYRQPAVLGERRQPGVGDEPEGLSWVTVAAYFPRSQQSNAMLSAGYAGYLSKVFVVGTEAQRQELRADGTFGEWEDVSPSKAMPTVEVPTPIIDDRSGAVLNQAELDQAFERVRAYQDALLQPPFYEWKGGDPWEVPPLRGHEDVEEEEPEADKPTPREPDRPRAPQPPPPRPPPGTPPPGQRPGSLPPGGFGGGPPGGFSGGPPGVPPGQRPGGVGGGAGGDNKAAARREIAKALSDASKALARNPQESQRLAQSVLSNPHKTRADERRANDILRRAEKALQRLQERAAGPRPGGAEAALIVDPETSEPAVWFHDDSVTPGKTYRYRLRVKLWNRYVGRMQSLKDPAQARQAVLVGEWSLPSDPVTVAARKHFFVRGPRPRGTEPTASVDVFTWHEGAWLKESFDVQVGDVIGGRRETRIAERDDENRPKRAMVDFTTDALVLDIRPDEPTLQRRLAGKSGEFAYSARPSLVLVYLDPADGQVKERVAAADLNDRLYKKLNDEYKEIVE